MSTKETGLDALSTTLSGSPRLAKTAMVFGVPTILTTVLEERGGYRIQPLQDVAWRRWCR